MGEVPSEAARHAASAIIGADERQRAELAHDVLPPPRFGRGIRLYLWIIAAAVFGDGVYHLATGRISSGIWLIALTPVAVLVRWGLFDGMRQARWQNPAYRNRVLKDERQAASDRTRSLDQ